MKKLWFMLLIKKITTFALLVCLTACAAPLPYVNKVRQGNYIDNNKFSKIDYGMSKKEVRSLVGEPMLTYISDDNRWDYFYSEYSTRRELVDEQLISIYFNNNKVVKIVENNFKDESQSGC